MEFRVNPKPNGCGCLPSLEQQALQCGYSAGPILVHDQLRHRY